MVNLRGKPENKEEAGKQGSSKSEGGPKSNEE